MNGPRGDRGFLGPREMFDGRRIKPGLRGGAGCGVELHADGEALATQRFGCLEAIGAVGGRR